MQWLARYAEPIHALTRMVIGFLFFCHGVQKIGAIVSGGGSQMPALVLYLAAAIESGGGALVAVGLKTRLAAFTCSGMMAVAYFSAHQPKGLLPIQNGGEPAVLFCWTFLLLATRGPGIWSVDAARAQAPTR